MLKLSRQLLSFILVLSVWLPTGTGASAQTITNYPAGIGPWAVAVNPVTNKTYVANHLTGVTVIEGTGTTTVATGYGPHAVAVNPVTNKIYVANDITDDVTVIDGATNIPTQVKDTPTAPGKTASKPYGVAVNPVTNKVYVANYGSDTVTVIDGATNGTVSIPAGTNPWAVAVNPVTNKIYVTNNGSSNVTVINGADNSVVATVGVGINPQAVAVNPRTNKVYVANQTSNSVSVINGVDDTISALTVPVGTSPKAMAINPVTNKIYVVNANVTTGSVSVIDGVTDSSSTIVTVTTGNFPQAITVNLVSNIVYVANTASANVTVIDGATNLTLPSIAVGTNPSAVAVNMITNEVFVANNGNDTVTVIAETAVLGTPLPTSITPLPGNTTNSATPTFTMTATSSTGSPVRTVYYQLDTVQGSWLAATPAGGGSFSGITPILTAGAHTLYAFAADGSDATSINTGSQSSPLIGSIASYPFTVSTVVPPVTYTVTPVNTAHGNISPSVAQMNVPSGASIDFTVTPDAGYKIDNVTGTGCSVLLFTPPATSPAVYRAGPVTADCTVTPTYSTVLLPVRIGATPYLNLVDAYAKASSGDVIEAMATTFSGDLNLTKQPGIAVTLYGGYDANYSTNPATMGNTVMIGKLIVGSGSLVVDRLVIQ
jgi:YVTN family beta-propeller protein